MLPGMTIAARRRAAGGYVFEQTTVAPPPVGNQNSTGSLTFSSQPFGDADANRYIIASITGRRVTSSGGWTLDSLTIGGVSASILAASYDRSAGDYMAAIAMAHVPSGTTGDVVLSLTRPGGVGQFRLVPVLYRLLGGVPSLYDKDELSGAFPLTANLDVPANGIGVAVAIDANGSPAISSTVWTEMSLDFFTSFIYWTRYVAQKQLAPAVGVSVPFAKGSPAGPSALAAVTLEVSDVGS